jgi:hypothetical protein
VVFQKGSQWYAQLNSTQLNSLTNSNYSVIWNTIKVALGLYREDLLGISMGKNKQATADQIEKTIIPEIIQNKQTGLNKQKEKISTGTIFTTLRIYYKGNELLRRML